MTVRTRFAPSPTGYLHIGGARTALFSWLYARKRGGQFVLRIEDTDLQRSTEESVNAILEGLSWLGLDYDEGPFYQTHRFDRYKEIIQQLLDSGHAYRCYCSKERLDSLREEQMAARIKPRYDGLCLDKVPDDENAPHVIRFRNPKEGSVFINDLIRGNVEISNSELDDLILARTDGSPTYNLTVVVDDMDMQITHVIRGDDHLNNTPRQINILKALSAELPIYAHLPMILGDDGARLSKRHGAVSVMQYHDDGILPEALLNHLVRLGWSHGDEEIFSVEQMIELFDIEDVNKSASAFNTDKLKWFNQHYIKNDDPARLAQLLSPLMAKLGIDPTDGPNLRKVVEAQQERASTLVEMAGISAFFYKDFDEYDTKSAKKHLKAGAREPLVRLRERFDALSDWQCEALHQVVQDISTELKLGMAKVAMPLRVAVVGRAASPSIDITLQLIGKQVCLRRIDKALEFIDARVAAAG